MDTREYICERGPWKQGGACQCGTHKKDAITTGILIDELDRPVPPHESCYEFTITTTKDDPYELRSILAKLCESDMFEVVLAYACIELTKAGLPHVHSVIYSKRKYLDGSKIKKFTPYRYEFKKVRFEGSYINYIKKESGNPSIQQYCEGKGISQFWYAV